MEVIVLRVVGRFPDQRQASGFIDSIKNAGFDRKDLIVSNPAEDKHYNSLKDAAEDMIFIKSERDGLGDYGSFADGVEGLEGRTGIIVAVEAPKHSADRIRSIMEQSGAVEIVRD